MKLKSVKISNYRSIEELSFDINPLDDGSSTYGLIGVNEAGKSTALKALALKDGLKPLAKDFKSRSIPIKIEYFYELSGSEVSKGCKDLLDTHPNLGVSKSDLETVCIVVSFDFSNPGQSKTEINLINIAEDSANKATIQNLIKEIIISKVHKAIFWTAEDRYLISHPINRDQFSQNPDGVSIPLKNCFLLAGINDIKSRIDSLAGDSTEVEQLEKELGEKVTKHIKSVWPKHPIEITFKIAEGLINFHVKDEGANGKAKTADQRSDGFKQFISFLLTVSAQNKNSQLSNSILLLDEPETHLHPQAQEDFLKELIEITKNNKNNIVFFATHSNYMIDKDDLSRNYKIEKEKDATKKERFDKKESTYASVSYEVFGISSADYHNELYDKLRARYKEDRASKDGSEDKKNLSNFDEVFFTQQKKLPKHYPRKGEKNKATLPTYVRNAIHYPETKDKNFSEHLRKSIELLREYEK